MKTVMKIPGIYTIRNPDDVLKLGININFKELNEKYFRFQVYTQIDPVPISNKFDELLQNIENFQT